ncbi:anaphase-promoting complex subunit [Chloropicon primus]|uniref:Anaphase-promoting complex subunit 6 n=2 Tax=Chloropicon primus TaxID=1764295 RepID=A0A5B8MYJ3_9CHLO|nr:hypothetical protein A3770_13p69820 [Chloropicon primus]UPR03673.1 anaphase-promoting complex subunit [Chloropicon primus]|eukprot:QDZ24464.1 hypothetical protein A3770_13p69820 [Chloropicon primus]
MDSSEEEVELEALRGLVQDCVEKHCYRSATFFGDKVCLMSGGENRDVYQLCQTYYYSGQHSRALHRLTKHRKELEKARAERGTAANGSGVVEEEWKAFAYLTALCLAECKEWERCLQVLEEDQEKGEGKREAGGGSDVSRRGVAVSLFSKRMETGEEEDGDAARRGSSGEGRGRAKRGPWKTKLELESAMCVLRAKCYESMDNREKAKRFYIMALEQSDPFCYEAFEALIGNHMLSSEEESSLFSNLDSEVRGHQWLKLLYECKGKKYGKVEQIQEKLNVLGDEGGVGESLDVLTCKSEFLYHCCEYQQCYEVTSRVVAEDSYFLDCLPVHVACAVALGRKNDLFLLGHKLVEEMPERAVAWFAVGAYYYCIKAWDSAERYFQKATGIEKDFAPAWIGYGHTLAAKEEHDQAMAAYRTASRLFQGLHEPLLCLGMEFAKTNNLGMANDFFQKALKIAAEDPLVLNELGVLAYQRGEYSLAVKNFKGALDLAGVDPWSNKEWEPTINNLGHALRKAGRYEEALEHFKRASGLKGQASTYSSMAFTHQLMGHTDKAIELYHKALGIQDCAFSSDMLLICLKEVAFVSL